MIERHWSLLVDALDFGATGSAPAMPRLVLSLLVGLSALAGCATPYIQAQTALRQGRYDEATAHFEDVLARDPGRLDALGPPCLEGDRLEGQV